MPSMRTDFYKDISACGRAVVKLSKSSRLDTTAGTDRLRVMISHATKSTRATTI